MCIFCFACAVAESRIFALYPLFNILRENVKRCEEMFKLCIEKSGTHIGCGRVAGMWVRRLKQRGRELSPTCSSTFRVPPCRLNAPSSVGLGCESNTGWSPGVRLLYFSYFFSVSFVLYSAEGRLVCPPGKAHPWLFVPYPVGGGYLDLVPFPAKLEVRGPANVC